MTASKNIVYIGSTLVHTTKNIHEEVPKGITLSDLMTRSRTYSIEVGIWDCDVSNCCWENPFGFRSVDKHSLVKRILHLGISTTTEDDPRG